MKKIYNIPNILTLTRLILIIPVLILLYFNNKTSNLISAILFVIASITDIVDGYIARKLNQVTTFGKLIDPLADKLLILSVLIMLVKLNRIPVVFALIIISREFIITGLRSVASSEGIIISANQMGKDKTFFQTVSFTCLIIYYPLFGINSYSIGIFFLIIAVFYTIISGYKYIKEFITTMKSINKSNEK